jgi:hypothetical protein
MGCALWSIPSLALAAWLGSGGSAPASVAQLPASLAYCRTVAQLDLPAWLPLAVVETEGRLNTTFTDDLQDQVFRRALDAHDAAWWTAWANRNAGLARRSLSLRARSGKWPADLVISGYVISVGPAQITPRTLLAACQGRADLAACEGGAREVLLRLFDEAAAPELAAIVISHERRRFCAGLAATRCAPSSLQLAGLYNWGTDIYLARRGRRFRPNAFTDGVRRSPYFARTDGDGLCDGVTNPGRASAKDTR